MLVLTRKTDERLLIDGGIEIRILGVQGSRVRLGIEAPPEVRVRRAELEDRGSCGETRILAQRAGQPAVSRTVGATSVT